MVSSPSVRHKASFHQWKAVDFSVIMHLRLRDTAYIASFLQNNSAKVRLRLLLLMRSVHAQNHRDWVSSLKTLEAVLHLEDYQQWCPSSQPSPFPLWASLCWCHRQQPLTPGARPSLSWSSCWKCPAMTASGRSVPPASVAAPAESERTPGNGKKCHLKIITGNTDVYCQ